MALDVTSEGEKMKDRKICRILDIRKKFEIRNAKRSRSKDRDQRSERRETEYRGDGVKTVNSKP